MRTIIARLFGRSPIPPLQFHMSKVAECVQKVDDLFSALNAGDYEKIKTISEQISESEHAADLAKDDLRNDLAHGVFLPVDKTTLLTILALQDSIADKCEDIGVLLTLKRLELSETFKDDFQQFLSKNLETFGVAQRIIQQLDELLSTSFAGVEAEKVKKMVDDVAFKEHEADLLQRRLLQRLFELESAMPHGTFYLWQKIFEAVGNLSNLSENLGHRVRTLLDLKS
ncbi:MAG: TIGR00153 family protein [candidate division KSB1 bacterium]|nr:TIGR00153 family protein [candidate division KSB1 bacterium]MDZ7301714.1 TIGR00153 family protein [candidate division KSB1 bacterium]MDZ7312399.1 TIGR00153 family protein [candidate division KSB1 bacterium]